ncbi:MAG: chemotaxis protein CheW [Pseudomonadota bacterium]
MKTSEAYNLLSRLRDQAVEFAESGGRVIKQAGAARGIGFVVNGQRFYCEADVIKEVANCQNLIDVPQTKNWMRGMFNSKGVLYSVVDMGMLAGLERGITPNKGHLMLLGDIAGQSALLVNRVSGFRQFDFSSSGEVEKSDDRDAGWWDSLSAFVGDEVFDGDESWRYLDISQLVGSEVFREVQ